MPTPTITFRIPKNLQDMAKSKAKKMGIPLTVIMQKALETFVNTKTITVTENGFTPEFENLVIEAESESNSDRFVSSKDAINHFRNL